MVQQGLVVLHSPPLLGVPERLADLDPDLSHLYSDPAMTDQFWGLKKWVEYD